MLPPFQLLNWYNVPLTPSVIPSSPLAEGGGGDDYFGLFGLKGVSSKKFALQNFEVGGRVLVEKMHTRETKKYHFFKYLFNL